MAVFPLLARAILPDRFSKRVSPFLSLLIPELSFGKKKGYIKEGDLCG